MLNMYSQLDCSHWVGRISAVAGMAVRTHITLA